MNNQCSQCGAAIIAAEWSEHLSDHCVRNIWSCDDCGYQFEDTIYLPPRKLADRTIGSEASPAAYPR